jgi:hypothetical protein
MSQTNGTDTWLANNAPDEAAYRFPSFSANDAVSLSPSRTQNTINGKCRVSESGRKIQPMT